MNKEFIPYEEALALKMLGFEENCIKYYVPRKDHDDSIRYILDWDGIDYSKDCKAPLYQQAFRWFRDKHNLFMYMQVGMHNGEYQTFYFNVIQFGKNLYKSKFRSETSTYTYEEAELACLRKLIEIVKIKL